MSERARAERVVKTYAALQTYKGDCQAALELLGSDEDAELMAEARGAFEKLVKSLEREEFLCKMSGEFDANSAIIEINAGAGGTEAQDWANMMLRMYTRWAERKGFTPELYDFQPGEVAGMKSATLVISGEYAYGYLRSEQGVHRLVRISPFDSNARRHTSFCSIGVTPEFGEDVPVDVNEADINMDTYRSGGAGGQYVNKTDSAVRLTHVPTGLVVACQTERSQHKNRAQAMKILKSKLYELQKEQQADRLDSIRGERKKIEWGSQIRSYVMQPYQLVNDLRIEFKTSAIEAVLDGDLDPLIEAYLLSGENRQKPVKAEFSPEDG